MAAPTTYSDWSNCLDVFASGTDDGRVIGDMSAGTLDWSSGVAELFSERMIAAVNIRLRRVADRLTRELSRGMDETTVVRAVMDARRSLGLLHRVASMNSLAPALRDHLLQEIQKYARNAQQSLEGSARSDRTGRLLLLLRNNSLERFTPAAT